jgi:hypothetical protein
MLSRLRLTTAPIALVFAAAGCASAVQATSSSTPLRAGGSGSNGAQTPDEARVRSAVEQALRVDQQLESWTRHPNNGAPNSYEINQKQRDDTAAINSIFAGKAVAKEKWVLQNSIDQAANPDHRSGAAGVRNIRYFAVTLVGTSATARATADSWAEFSEKDGKGAWHAYTPNNTELVTVTLSKEPDGRWKVQTFDWTFAPGTGP